MELTDEERKALDLFRMMPAAGRVAAISRLRQMAHHPAAPERAASEAPFASRLPGASEIGLQTRARLLTEALALVRP